MAVKIDAGDGALAHADGRAAVAGDEVSEKLKTIGVVGDHQDAVAVSVFGEKLLEGGVGAVKAEGGTDFDFGLVAELGGHKLRGLQGALEGAGDDHVNLDLERAEQASHQHALVFSFFDEAALAVEGGISASKSGVGVAHEIEVHRGRPEG